MTILKIDHWESSDPNLSVEDIGKLIESYLKKNGFRYLVASQYTYMEGILISIEDIGTVDFPERTEELQKISDLAAFLFDKLQIGKRCLHFISGRKMLNGYGQPESGYIHIDSVIFTELTGISAPEEFKPKTKEDFLKFIKDVYSENDQ